MYQKIALIKNWIIEVFEDEQGDYVDHGSG